MVNYTCEKCNKEFNRKCNYLEHLNKKKPCRLIIETTNEPPVTFKIPPNINILDDNINKCMYCGDIFTRKDVLKRHIDNRCKVKKLRDEDEEKDKENIFKLLLAKEEEIKKINEENKKKDEEIKKKDEESNKKINKLEDYVKKLTDMNIELNNKVGKLLEKMSINNITNITNNTNNNIINISKEKLVNFGEEDVKEIELKLFNNCFNKFGKFIFEASAKNIWFNNSKNKNFYISDLSRDKAMTYKNGQFHITPINTVLTTINQQLYKYFKYNIEEIKKTKDKKLMEKVEKEIMQAYKMFFNAFDDEKDLYIPSNERLEEFSKVVNDHLSKFFSDVKKDIIDNYKKIKQDTLDDNLLKQIGYEPPKKGRGRPKKINKVEEIKVTTIPKSVSGKNEIKNILNDIKEEIKDIKKNKKSDKKEEKKEDKKLDKKDDKKNKKGPGMTINRKGVITEVYDSDSE